MSEATRARAWRSWPTLAGVKFGRVREAVRRGSWRVRLWFARRQVRRALAMIRRQMDRAGMSRSARRKFYRDLAEDRLDYLGVFWKR
jgi:hypothetical protein